MVVEVAMRELGSGGDGSDVPNMMVVTVADAMEVEVVVAGWLQRLNELRRRRRMVAIAQLHFTHAHTQGTQG